MEEKLFGIILAEARLTDMCANKLNAVLVTLKRQRFINVALCLCVASCVSNITNLHKKVIEQKSDIKKLKEKLFIEEMKEAKKGE